MTGSPPSPLPGRGCLMGLDYGSKRVGVAVCDSGQSIASPLEVVFNAPGIAASLKEIADEYTIAGLVVGLPVHMSGDEGEKAKAAREFGDRMAMAMEIPVVYHDERFTSQMADNAMAEAGLSRAQRKARIDMLAAQFMLQAFLDSGCQEIQPPPLNDD